MTEPAGSASPPRTRGQKAAATASDSSSSKKETFQWSTPADEFADDVGSDIDDRTDDDGDDDHDDDHENGGHDQGSVAVDQDGGIIINLGVDEADKYALSNGDSARDDKSSIPRKRGKKSKSRQQFPCPKCYKIWNWPWELRRHLVMHFKEKERQAASTYKCDECHRGFQWKRDLAQHKRLHTGEKLLICSVCGKKFTTRQALLHHVVVHTGEKPFQCAQCGNRFTQPANLRTHMKKKHGGATIKGNKCPHCAESFPSVIAVHQHILEDHQHIVAEEREVQALEKLQREQEKADKERQREDNKRKREERRKEKMDMNDFRARGLKEWEITYEFHLGDGLVRGVDWDRTPSNGELPCDLCERKFGWRYEIMFHSLCHLTDGEGNPKNRVCPECDTVFKVPIGLKHHLLLHTGELPFLCLHCWRSFSSHIDLKMHIRREHLFHLDMPTPNKTGVKKKEKKELKEEHMAAAVSSELHEEQQHEEQQQQQQQQQQHVQLVMASSEGDGSGETQTIVLGSDGNNQDMIVVIQSDDFDQSQGMIVVDPSQLQQVVAASGGHLPSNISVATTSSGGETMTIVGDTTSTVSADHGEMIVTEAAGHGGQQYINLQMPDGTSQRGAILLTDASGQQLSGSNYIVVSNEGQVSAAADSKVGLQYVERQQTEEAGGEEEQQQGGDAILPDQQEQAIGQEEPSENIEAGNKDTTT